MEALSYNDWGNRVVQLVTLRLARARTLTLALTTSPDPDPGPDHDPLTTPLGSSVPAGAIRSR